LVHDRVKRGGYFKCVNKPLVSVGCKFFSDGVIVVREEEICATQVIINHCSMKCFIVTLNATGLMIKVLPSRLFQKERRFIGAKAN
jgi:hypothetical protein